MDPEKAREIIEGANYLLKVQKERLLAELGLDVSEENGGGSSISREEAEELLDKVFLCLFGFGLDALSSEERTEVNVVFQLL